MSFEFKVASSTYGHDGRIVEMLSANMEVGLKDIHTRIFRTQLNELREFPGMREFTAYYGGNFVRLILEECADDTL